MSACKEHGFKWCLCDHDPQEFPPVKDTRDPFGKFGFDLEAMCTFIPKLRPLIHDEIKRACGEHLSRADLYYALHERLKANYSALATAAKSVLVGTGESVPMPRTSSDGTVPVYRYLLQALRKAL